MFDTYRNILQVYFFLHVGCNGIRCYSDHSGPNSAGGIERCDADAVCSLARFNFIQYMRGII